MDHGFGNWPTHHALRNADRIAYIDGPDGVECRWRDVEEHTNRLADALNRRGIQHGDRVALLTHNSPQMMELFFAIAKLGAIAVPVNWRLHPREINYILNDSGAITLFHSEAFGDTARAAMDLGTPVRFTVSIPSQADRANGVDGEFGSFLESGNPDRVVRQVSHDDVCCLMYTSGTTGRPKGAMLTHGNFFANAVNAFGYGGGIGRYDVTISAAPLFHIGALGIHTLPLAFIGGATVIMESFTPDAWLDAVEAHRVTRAFLVPAMWLAVLAALDQRERDLSSLELAITGGAPCPLDVIRGLRARGVSFTEGYGMTETSPNAACLQMEDVERKAGSIGRPVTLVDFRLLDDQDRDVAPGEVGELCLRGPNVFMGYWNKPEATGQAIRDGWFHTGDLARVDKEGFYTLVDRKKDMVITGGENVYPIEVERVVAEHPSVVDVAVIGLPDQKWGERVVAVVVKRPDDQLGAEELREWIRRRIAGYKAPKEIQFIDILPRTATGKVLKRTLRENLSGSTSAVNR